MARVTPSSVFAALRRQWLLIVIVTVVGAGVSVGLTVLREPSVVASRTIEINDSALQRTPGLPGGERTLQAMRTTEYYEAVAEAAGMDVAEVRAGLNSYGVGAPMIQIKVTFTSA